MIIVSDTTPLISLMKIGQLGLLEKFAGSVAIPFAVFQELISNPKFSEEAELIINATFLTAHSVKSTELLKKLREETNLDLGESEAIILAQELGADTLLVDEMKGRKVATRLGIHITGTIGLLVLAYREGLLSKSEAENSLKQLKETNLRLSDSLIDGAWESIR